MSEMLEKVARQVNDEMPHLAKWETLTPGIKAECIDVVRRVVRALREPSFEMVEAPAQEAIDCDPGMADDVWQAMIDSILSTPTTRGGVK